MNIELRTWQIEDAEALQKIANDKDVSRYLRNTFPYPYALEDARAFISFALSMPNVYMRAVFVDEKLAGGCCLLVQEDVNSCSAKIGYWLGKDFWNKGIASRVVAQVCEYGFFHLPIVRIYAGVFSCNLASGRVLEKNGFILEGRLKKSICKDGVFMDELLYARVQ